MTPRKNCFRSSKDSGNFALCAKRHRREMFEKHASDFKHPNSFLVMLLKVIQVEGIGELQTFA